MTHLFQGQILIEPQVAVFVDDSGLAGQSVAGSGDLLLIGPAQGGQPNTPLYFTTPNQALSTLRGGDLLRAALRGFTPGPQAVGAPRVVCIRTGSATQASVTLKDANNKNSIVVTSTDFGGWTNLIQVACNSGTDFGRKITVRYGTTSIVIDDVARPSLSFTYNGSSTTVGVAVGPVADPAAAKTTTTASSIATATSLTVASASAWSAASGGSPLQAFVGYPGSAAAEVVSVTAGSGTTLTVSACVNAHASGVPVTLYNGEQGLAVSAMTGSTDNPADDVVLLFNQYRTIQDIVNYFNARTNYAATVTTILSSDPSNSLDGVVSGTTVTPASAFNLSANLYGTVLAINAQAAGFVTAAAASGAVAAPAIEGTTIWHLLSGGTDGTVTPSTQDWTTALQAATTIDVSVVVPATGNSTVHAMVQAHCDLMSTMQMKRERICLVGGVAGENVTAVIARANALRDERTGLVYPGIIDFDATQQALGVITLDPWLVAAQLGGMFCGGGVREALTNKFVSARGVENLLNQADQQTLLLSGIIPVVYVQNQGFKVLHSGSTWTADNNYRHTELSVMRASDFLVKSVRAACQPLIGQIVEPSLEQRVRSVVSSTLKTLWDNGIIVGNAQNPAYRNITVQSDGDAINVAFQVAIAIPANYILLTASLLPYSSTGS